MLQTAYRQQDIHRKLKKKKLKLLQTGEKKNTIFVDILPRQKQKFENKNTDKLVTQIFTPKQSAKKTWRYLHSQIKFLN